MIPSHDPTEVIPITLEHDKTNPTVWHITMSHEEEYQKHIAQQAQLKRAIDTAAAGRPEDVIERVTRLVGSDTDYLTKHVTMIENAWPDGKTIENIKERRVYLHNLARFDRLRLAEAISNGVLAELLRKKLDSSSTSPEPATTPSGS